MRQYDGYRECGDLRQDKQRESPGMIGIRGAAWIGEGGPHKAAAATIRQMPALTAALASGRRCARRGGAPAGLQGRPGRRR